LPAKAYFPYCSSTAIALPQTAHFYPEGGDRDVPPKQLYPPIRLGQ